MMKIILLLLVMFACTASPKEYRFKLRGDIINADKGLVKLYSLEDTLKMLMTTEMNEGQFVLEGRLHEQGVYLLEIAGKRLPIVLDGVDMTLYADQLELSTKLLKGSPALKTRLALERLLREKYESRLNEVIGEYSALIEKGRVADAENFLAPAFQATEKYRRELILDFVQDHPDDLYLPVFIREDMGENDAYGKQALERMSTKVQASQPGRLLKMHLDK